jgi:hypothetical protein
MIVDEVRAAGRTRRLTEARAARMAEEAAERKHREEHPEDFEPITAADLEAMAAKLPSFDYERPKAKVQAQKPKDAVVPEKPLLSCPHCSAELPVPQNIRFWTSSELRDHADTLDELQRLADKNRVAQ